MSSQFNYWLRGGWLEDYQTKADQQVNSGINAEPGAVFALDVEVDPNDPTGQTLRCVNEEARRFGCEPFNVFGEGTISPEAVEYLALNTQTDQLVQQAIVGLELVGEANFLPNLPAGAIGFATGVEYREEKGSQIPDASVVAGVTTSNKILPTSGTWNVAEGFLEISLPIIEQLTIDAAGRYGDYSTVGGQFNWMVGFDAPVTDWVRFRGTYSNAVRAPNVSDLFSGAGETFATAQDACDGVTADTPGNLGINCRSVEAIADRIADTGAFTLTQVERQSTGGFNSGNPEATEETADTYTLGFIVTPSSGFLSNFQLAVYYYNISLEDVLALPSRSDVVTNCYSVDPSVFDQFCPGPVQNGVQTLRDPRTGVLLEVNRSVLAQEDWETDGVDIELNYSSEFGPGIFDFNMLWSHINKFEITDKTTGNVNVETGEILFPDNRVYAGFNYNMDAWAFNWTVSWIDRAKDSATPEDTNENSDTFGFPLDKNGNECSATAYHSLSVNYDPQKTYSLYAGVQNLFDKDPCALTQITKYGNTGTNTAAEVYDVTGRSYFLGLRARF